MYIVYKTTNKLTNEYYIGIHKTNKLDDGYLGSGYRIKRAIIKYGKQSFTKQILYYCQSMEQMCNKQKQLVTKQMLADSLCYNLTLGGGCGFYYINHGPRHEQFIAKMKKTIKENGTNKGKNNSMYGKRHTQQTKNKISKANKGRLIGDKNPSKRLDVRKKLRQDKLGLKNPNGYLWKLISPEGVQHLIQGGIKRNIKKFKLDYQYFNLYIDGIKYSSGKKAAGWKLIKLYKNS